MNIQKTRVLAIDDQPSFLEAVARMLTRLGFEPVLATSAQEGMDKLRRMTCGAMLVDLRMPDVPGQALLRELNRAGSPVPVVVMSGTGSIDDVILAFRDNAVDFLRKPFALEQLSTALERALGKRRPPVEPPSAAPSSVRLPPKPRDTPVLAREVFSCVNPSELRLPVLDPRIAELHSLLTSEECDMRHFASVVAQDAALCAAVMRRAGSAGARGASSSGVHEACTRLGTRELIRVALQTLYESQFTTPVEPFRGLMAQSWANALATSRVAAELAKQLGRADVARLQMLGLTHNLGELACLAMLAQAPASCSADQVGVDVARHHERVGETVAKAWKLPPDLARVAGAHHRPADLDGAIVLAAWTCASLAGFEPLPGQRIGDPYQPLRRLGLSERSLEPLLEVAIGPRDENKRTTGMRRLEPVHERLRRHTMG